MKDRKTLIVNSEIDNYVSIIAMLENKTKERVTQEALLQYIKPYQTQIKKIAELKVDNSTNR